MGSKTHANADISPRMTALLAVAAGLIVANLYYAQTLIGPISTATGLSPDAAGLIVTLTQVGYALGLLFIVPLGDILENRKLVIALLAATAAMLAAAAFSGSAGLFLATSLGIGLGSVAAQILVPFAAHLSAEATRGQNVGKVVSGLLLGIMLARPAASLVADNVGWRAVYGIAAVLIAILAFVLQARLPRRQPGATLPYARLIGSMWGLLATTPVLRRRAAYHAGMFASFSLFWTITPLMLAGPVFKLSQTGIALFALAGMAGAVVSPLAGRLADRGRTLVATAVALLLGVASFALPMLVPASRDAALGMLVLASIILDMGVAANLVLSQRAIFALGAHLRSRLNGVFFALFFAGGAIGSALGAWVYTRHGWHSAFLAGMAFPAAGLVYWIREWAAERRAPRAQSLPL